MPMDRPEKITKRITNRAVVIPGWANSIRLDREATSQHEIVLEGFDVQHEPFLMDHGPDKRVNDFFASGPKGPRSVIQFLEANTPELQEQFVLKYGPVNATCEYNERCDGFIARQNRAVLAAEQRIFENLFGVCDALRALDDWARGGKGVGDWPSGGVEADKLFRKKHRGMAWQTTDQFLRYRRQLGHPEPQLKSASLERALEESARAIDDYPRALLPARSQSQWQFDRIDRLPFAMIGSCDAAYLYEGSHRLICSVLNLFPLALHYLDGRVVELATANHSGVLPLLYSHLREQILSRRLYRRCARSACGSWFLPRRSDQIYHDTSCKNAAVQERYRRAALSSSNTGDALSGE